jgi:hypothetical protein
MHHSPPTQLSSKESKEDRRKESEEKRRRYDLDEKQRYFSAINKLGARKPCFQIQDIIKWTRDLELQRYISNCEAYYSRYDSPILANYSEVKTPFDGYWQGECKVFSSRTETREVGGYEYVDCNYGGYGSNVFHTSSTETTQYAYDITYEIIWTLKSIVEKSLLKAAAEAIQNYLQVNNIDIDDSSCAFPADGQFLLDQTDRILTEDIRYTYFESEDTVSDAMRPGLLHYFPGEADKNWILEENKRHRPAVKKEQEAITKICRSKNLCAVEKEIETLRDFGRNQIAIMILLGCIDRTLDSSCCFTCCGLLGLSKSKIEKVVLAAQEASIHIFFRPEQREKRCATMAKTAVEARIEKNKKAINYLLIYGAFKEDSNKILQIICSYLDVFSTSTYVPPTTYSLNSSTTLCSSSPSLLTMTMSSLSSSSPASTASAVISS